MTSSADEAGPVAPELNVSTLPPASQDAASPGEEKPEATSAEGQEPAPREPPKEGEPEAPDKRAERSRERYRSMHAKWQEAEARARILESELTRIKAKPAPSQDNYDNPDDYVAARAAHAVRQDQAEDREVEAEHQRQAATAARAIAFNSRCDEMRNRVPDFDQVVTTELPVSEAAAQVIANSDHGPEMIYHLGKNREYAERLDRLIQTNPAAGLIELGRLEARISAPAPRTTSQAPKPPAVLNGGTSPPAFDAHTASIEDFDKRFRQQGLIR